MAVFVTAVRQINFIEDAQQLFATLQTIIKDGDIILTQGAGTIGKIAKQLAASFEGCLV